MYKMPQSIKQNATIGGGGHFDPLLGWRGCRNSLGIVGLMPSQVLTASQLLGQLAQAFRMTTLTAYLVSAPVTVYVSAGHGFNGET